MDITLPQTINTTFDQYHPHILRLKEETWCIIDGTLYEITPGFWFDGMSMPRPLWPIMGHPFTVKLIIQVLWHDIFFATQIFKESRCNRILEAMNIQRNKDWEENDIKCSIGFAKRKAISAGLGTFGWIAYNSKKEKEIKGASKHLKVNGKIFIP